MIEIHTYDINQISNEFNFELMELKVKIRHLKVTNRFLCEFEKV